MTPGSKVGGYEIVALIGAGGMGDVYRARDTKLKRDVALKVLPEQFARDAGRMARFQREAEVLASLNHPNIAHIYGVEERALVMELVEGESPKGPMPFEDAWKIAMQIADALEYAHERGVIHRDLKPANVKVTPEGVVKLLDFGLAKAFIDQPESVGNPENSPTVTLGATVAGSILGTAAYMAPEQAKGKRVDKRADIWSWGVVLYELLTGERLFKGEDAADTLAQVLTKQPDLDRVPPQVRKLLSRCLEKDPKQRLRDIGDARDLLVAQPVLPAVSQWRLGWIAATAFAVLAAVIAFVHFRSAPAPQRALRLSVPLPEDSSVLYLELSPDAKRLALLLSREDKYQLYVRALDSDELQPLPGTEGALAPFWSPDSRFIGFTGDGKLKIIPAAGGPAQVLCDSLATGGGAWSRNGVILFSDQSGFKRANAVGGPCTSLGKSEPGVGLPEFLPDGNHFFYIRQSLTDNAATGLYLASLDEPVGHKILPDLSNVVYTPPASDGGRAHFLFLRDNAIMAQPFDNASLQLVGDPFLVAARGSPSLTQFMAASAAPDGTLVYLAGRSRVTQLTWFDRSGKELGKVGPRAEQGGVSLSPDGQMVAMVRTGRPPEEWVYDLARGPQIRLTPAGSSSTSGAVWAPGDGSVVFGMFGPAGPGIYRTNSNGGPPHLLMKSEATLPRAPSSLSRDGRFLVYSEKGGIWYARLESGKPSGDGTRICDGAQGQLSPDGRWLAYSSGIGGGQVQIRPFPDGAGIWQVPSENAQEARWSSDGKELYFISGAILGRVGMMSVAIESDGHGGLRIPAPQRLFDIRVNRLSPLSSAFSYNPAPDGKRFLVNELVDTAEPTVNVITNWQKAVGR
jgi:Tol biopolymer transport system component